MLITPASLHDLFVGFNKAYDIGFAGAPSTYQTIAMNVASSTAEERYPFMNSVPQLREWLGDRVVANLKLHAFTIENKKFEATISISADKIADDQYGVFGPLFEMMGQNIKQHPDKIVYALLPEGKTTNCYDGQPFFSETHPIQIAGMAPTTASNYQPAPSGYAGPSWYLVDSSRPIKPMVFQTRQPYLFQAVVDPNDAYVFTKDEYLYGVKARVNAGFALWQLAYCSDAPLTTENYAAARAAMISIRKENGDKMGVVPTHLVVPATLEGAGRQVVKNELLALTVTTGEPPVSQTVAVSNEWAGSADLIMTPWL